MHYRYAMRNDFTDMQYVHRYTLHSPNLMTLYTLFYFTLT